MSTQGQKYQTQWASQFYAAAELTRRGYQVAFTLGNAQDVDLMVISPKNDQFKVDVKGQAHRSFWLVQQRKEDPKLYFMLVYVPELDKPPCYYILSNDEMMARREEYRQHIEATSGRYRDNLGGLNWSTALDYEDHWEVLPE
jgi:hypothetical protein